MEVLSKMLNSTARRGIISYHPKCQKVNITHLCFTDDLVVFTSAPPSSLMGIQTVLDDFHSVSGLSVSNGKSKLYCRGVSKEVNDNLATIMGLKSGMLPVRYLGVPLSC